MQYPCPLDFGLVFISRLHCSFFGKSLNATASAAILWRYWSFFSVYEGEVGNLDLEVGIGKPRSWIQLFGEESRTCCYLSIGKIIILSSLSFVPPLCRNLMPHLTLRICLSLAFLNDSATVHYVRHSQPRFFIPPYLSFLSQVVPSHRSPRHIVGFQQKGGQKKVAK
jgi:hypothetical protein